MKRKELILLLCLFFSFAAVSQKRVTGLVLDEQGYPIPGTTILELGTTNGVIADVDGNFSLEVASESSVLQVSFVGMQTQEITVGNQSNINIIMVSALSDLDEVVVIGYGTRKKKLVTGANLSVGGEELQRQNSTKALEAIQSFAPGVNIVQASGMPGEDFKVNIRGLGTVGQSAPLYVIDGVAGGDINALNPADIESIDVLKDAASAAIYGSRAANGVILVTTKGGQKGRITVTYDGFYGVQNVAKWVEPLNAKQFIDIYTEEWITSGKPANEMTDFTKLKHWDQIQSGQFKGTNWLKEIENKNAPYQNHAVNISGGSDQSQFALGFSYSSQEGVLGSPVEPHNDQYTFRINSDHSIYKKGDMDIVKVGQTLNYRFRERSGVAIGGMYYNDVRNMLAGNPLVPVYNEKGELFMYPDLVEYGLAAISPRLYNPVAQMVLDRGSNETLNYNLNGNAYLQIQPVKGLFLKSSYGYRMFANAYRNYQPQYHIANDVQLNPGRINQNAGSGYSWTLENTINFSFDISSHGFDLLVGQSVERWGYGSSVNATNANPTFDGFKYAYLDNTDGITPGVTRTTGGPNSQGSLASFFGRLEYDFKEKYLLTLVIRADGSSNFAPGNQWGYFPSVAGGWILTEENFLADNGVVDFLKLRASWGQNGNQAIDPFQYMDLIGFDVQQNYRFGSDRSVMQLGGFPFKLANTDVGWETSEQLDLGLDAYFLRSRLQVAFDYYVKTTKDWLVRAPVADIQGAQAPDINGGDVENRGIELALRWDDRVGDFKYGAYFNVSKNENEVTKYGDNTGFMESNPSVISQGTDPVWRVEKGFPIGYFYGYKTAGVFQNAEQIQNWEHGFLQSNPQPGDLIFVDTNGDGIVSPEDKTMIGNPHPDVRIGFGLNFAYKGFDLSVSGKGAFGHQILKSYRSHADNEFHNYTTEILGRWTAEGTSSRIPRMTAGNTANRQNVSDLYIEDGDYIRVQDITLGYDFKKLFPSMPLGQARLYVAGRNLITITDYSGMDPEVGYGDDRSFVSGIDLGFYPAPKVYMVGVNLKF
jgi:TonB-linked SusC/RagA family outer membrane protein